MRIELLMAIEVCLRAAVEGNGQILKDVMRNPLFTYGQKVIN
jgi:hypothetical protein